MADENLDIYIRFLIEQAAQGNALKAVESLERQFKDFENEIKAIKRESAELVTISERLGRTSRGLLLAGTGIAGGIFAFASKYVKEAEQATVVTVAWKESQDSLSESGQKAGAVLAETALPLLQKAAELADKAAGFVETHPEIVRAALNTGVVLAGLGAVGTVLSKGIRLYADYLYLAAVAKEQQGFAYFDRSVNKFLAGTAKANIAGTAQGIAPAGAAGTAGLGSIVGTVLTLIGSALVGGLIGDKIGDAIAKKINPADTANYGPKDYINELKQLIAVDSYYLANLVGGQEKGLFIFDKIATLLGLREKSGDQQAATPVPTGVEASKSFQQVLDAYEKYRSDDLALVQKHYADRQKIIENSLQAERDSNRRFNASITAVRRQSGASIRQARENFNQESLKAERQYAENRAEIIRDAGEGLEKIEEQLRERLRKLSLDHAERMGDLVRDRDALGLVKEKRAYDRQRAEEIRNANDEIRQRRVETARRLQELDRQFAEERAQRYIDYQQRIAEIHAQSASRIAELKAQHREELLEIRRQRVDRIRELDSQFADERKRRYDQFIQNVRDLDASLLGEKQLRERYYQEMINDLNLFLESYKAGLKSLSDEAPSKTRAGGGYASYGRYLLGDTPGGKPGRPEFVLSGNTTEIAERALGGRLSQDRLIAALQFAGGNNQSIRYEDNRRMPSQGPIDRKVLQEDMTRIIDERLKNAFR